MQPMDQRNSQVSINSVKTDVVTSVRVTKAEKKMKKAEKKDIEQEEVDEIEQAEMNDFKT